MIKYLVDVNLSYKFIIWNNDAYKHIIEIDEEMPDSKIWEYAKENNLTIITKDTDFSNRIITKQPPPKVIHIKLGNMRLTDFRAFLLSKWKEIIEISNKIN